MKKVLLGLCVLAVLLASCTAPAAQTTNEASGPAKTAQPADAPVVNVILPTETQGYHDFTSNKNTYFYPLPPGDCEILVSSGANRGAIAPPDIVLTTTTDGSASPDSSECQDSWECHLSARITNNRPFVKITTNGFTQEMSVSYSCK